MNWLNQHIVAVLIGCHLVIAWIVATAWIAVKGSWYCGLLKLRPDDQDDFPILFHAFFWEASLAILIVAKSCRLIWKLAFSPAWALNRCLNPVVCPNCGARLAIKAVYCGKCGKRVQ